MPATMIYPGVYVEQPSVKPNTKAYKYASMYSDLRFQNWQLSLELAADAYKKNMSAYEAELRAIQQTKESARKTIDSIQTDIEKLQTAYLTTSEKEQATNVAAANSTSRFNVGQANASARSEYSANRSDARAATYYGNKPPNVYNQDTLDAARSSGLAMTENVTINEASVDKESKGYQMFRASLETKPGTAASEQDTLWADRYYFEAAMKKKGLDPTNAADKKTYVAKLDGKTKDAFVAAMESKIPLPSTSEGTSTTASAGRPDTTFAGTSFVDYTETQKARLRELYRLGGMPALAGVLPPDTDAKKLLDVLGIQATESALDKARAELAIIRNPEKPSADIVGSARDIYGQQFERLPGYERQQRYEAMSNDIATTMNAFAKKRISLLPTDATEAQIKDAVQEAYRDAAIWLTDSSYRPTWLQAPTSPAKASETTTSNAGTGTEGKSTGKAGSEYYDAGTVDMTKLPIQEVRLPDDDKYVYAYDGESDEYIVIYGPDSIGARFKAGSEAYKKLAAEGQLGDPLSTLPLVDVAILGETDYQYKFDPNKGVFIIAGGPANVGKEYGPGTAAYNKLIKEGVPGKMPAPTVVPTESKPEYSAETKRVIDILSGTYKPEAKPLEDKPSEPTKMSDIFTLSGLPEFSALMSTLPSKKAREAEAYRPPTTAQEKDTEAKIDSLVAAGELATKPRKVARLLATSWGQSVDNLYMANKKASNPMEFSGLRDQILISYKDYPKQAERMIQLLAAKYILEGMPVSEQVK